MAEEAEAETVLLPGDRHRFSRQLLDWSHRTVS